MDSLADECQILIVTGFEQLAFLIYPLNINLPSINWQVFGDDYQAVRFADNDAFPAGLD